MTHFCLYRKQFSAIIPLMQHDTITRADSAYRNYMARQSALFSQRIIAAANGETTWQDTLRAVCAEYHVFPSDVLHGGRHILIQRARAAAMRRLHKQGHSMTQIGKWMGRGHDTVSRTISGARCKNKGA